jgi:hypothetical protein
MLSAMAQRQRIYLELESNSDTLEGYVGSANGAQGARENGGGGERFSGYLELIAALERARETRDARRDGERGSAGGPSPATDSVAS